MSSSSSSRSSASEALWPAPLRSRRASRSDGGARGCFRRLTGRYLSADMCRGLLVYKYDGADLSLLYRFVLQPMNAQLIRMVPMWIAPNLLTLIGLSVVAAAYAATYVASPSFIDHMPPTLYLLCALALFLYQTIDNLDGRQARRTGSSSPLGLLFDHGVDALNCTLASLLLAAVYCVGQFSAPIVFLFWNIGFIPFVLATWEEYHTGKLILPVLNGPSDGMFLCMIFCGFGAVWPGFYFRTLAEQIPSVFKDTVVANVPVNATPLIIGYVGIFATIVGNMANVAKKKPLLGSSTSPSPLRELTPFAMLTVMKWSWVLIHPDFFIAHARVFCFSAGFLFCQMICSLMIAHVCDAPYKQFRRILIPLALAWCNCVLGPAMLPAVFPLVPPHVTLFALLAFHFLAWLHFITNAILEICELLQIRCFVITPTDVGHDGATPASRATAAVLKLSDGAHRLADNVEDLLHLSPPTPDAAGRHTGIQPFSPNTAEKLLQEHFEEDDIYIATDRNVPPTTEPRSARGNGPASAAGRRRKSAADKH